MSYDTEMATAYQDIKNATNTVITQEKLRHKIKAAWRYMVKWAIMAFLLGIMLTLPMIVALSFYIVWKDIEDSAWKILSWEIGPIKIATVILLLIFVASIMKGLRRRRK